MQRIIFTGDDLVDFPDEQEGGYVKLLFSRNGQAISKKSQLRIGQYLGRIYTIRSFNRDNNELVIEFSLYRRNAGLASKWAELTKPGDKILIDNPKLIKLVDDKSDWFLLAGDMSGLPAICCNLERLPSHAQGYVMIEVVSESDKQALKVPEGMAVSWIINDNPGKNSDALLTGIKSLPWKDGNPYVWMAGEFDSINKIRSYIESYNLDKENTYIASFWKPSYAEGNDGIGKQIDFVYKAIAKMLKF